MTDTVKSWIEERRAIHAKAAEGPWEFESGDPDDWTVVDGANDYIGQSPDDGVRAGFEEGNATAIVDAHNNLPRALDALNAILELHKPVHQVFSWQAGGTTAYDPCETCHGKAGVHECGCWADKDLIYTCAECRDGKGRDIDWPCATVQVIEGAISNE